MNELFNEDYYERGVELNISGYSNYRWIPELTIPLAFRIIEKLNIQEDETVLDFGCAKGYLVKALRLLFREAYGYDVSEYALSDAPHEIKKYLFNFLPDKKFDWVISKDVLEHVPYEMIDVILQDIKKLGNNFFIVIPLGSGGKYEVPSYEFDKTHIIRETKDWWSQKFEENGFEICYNEYFVKNIKENYSHYPKGNGFFILKRKEFL